MYRIVRIFHHRQILIIIILIAFFLGFTAGFLTLYFFQNQTSPIASIISALTIFLSASGMISLFHQLIKQKHEEESALTLEFEKINPYNDRYYLRVRKNDKAVGEIKDARGFITVRDTNIENISTVWANNKPKNSISIVADLTLFSIRNEKNIVFCSPTPLEETMTTESEWSYNDYKDKEIVVEIGSGNAPTFIYKDKIGNIVKVGKK